MSADLTAPCASCDHKKRPDGGWCYMMFRTPPTTVCLQHTAIKGVVNIFQILRTMDKVRATEEPRHG